MTKEIEWVNMGDVNPIEHGGFWIKKDEDSGNCFHVVEWYPVGERGGIMSDGCVDISDEWIDWKAVTEYADLHDDNTPEEMSRAVFDYYTPMDFGGNEHSMNKRAAFEWLFDRGIFIEDDSNPEPEVNEDLDLLRKIEASMVNPYPNEDYEDDLPDVDHDVDDEYCDDCGNTPCDCELKEEDEAEVNYEPFDFDPE